MPENHLQSLSSGWDDDAQPCATLSWAILTTHARCLATTRFVHYSVM